MKSKSKFILKFLGKYDPNYFIRSESDCVATLQSWPQIFNICDRLWVHENDWNEPK
jgi:hypothetical protein